MKSLVLISNSRFPLSAVAGAVLSGKLPDQYTPDTLWSALSSLQSHPHLEGQVYWLGQTPDGTQVTAFTARSGRVILRNMVDSFLQMSHVAKDHYTLIEIHSPFSLWFLLGEFLLDLPLVGKAGQWLIHRYIQKIYPFLVQSIQT